MSSDYPAGTLAIATVRGVEGVRVFRDEDGTDWASAVRVKNALFHTDDVVTDIRPLVVLDLDEMARRGGWSKTSYLIDSLARHGYSTLVAELCEQTKPPRIPEPGFDGAVTAGHKDSPTPHRWVRAWTNPAIGSHPWTDGDLLADWEDLIDPTLVREGIES